ncbi:TonB-dependent receptor plug domain-containing protein [Halovulum sp. GXIMD14793]
MVRSVLRGSVALVCLSFALPAAAQEGDDGYLGVLILTGGKRDLTFGTAVPRTVIDEEEIADRQGSTIGELIDSVPGVQLINGATPQGSGINIRGFGANTTYGTDQKIAIEIDGASVGSEELYRMGTQMFTDPMLYRDIEVLRGTIGSFAYGSGIVGGVVKLETKDASDFTDGEIGFGGSQTLQLNSNGLGFATSTNLAYKASERAEFLVNLTWRKHDDYKSGDGTEIGNTGFAMPSGLAKAKFRFGEDLDHELTFSYNQSVADDKDVPYDQFDTTDGLFGNVDRLTDTKQASLAYSWDPASELVNVEANLTYADQRIDYSYVPGSSPLEGTPSFPFLLNIINANQRYQTTKLRVTNTAKFATGAIDHKLLTGLEFQNRVRADNSAASAPGGTQQRWAAFVINEMKLGNFTATPALRYESSKIRPTNPLVVGPDTYTSFSADAIMGGVALDYDFGDGFSVFGSIAYTEGMPIIDDVGNLENVTTTEKSRTIEIGAEYTGKGVFAGGDSLTIRANGYRTRLWDVTSYFGVDTVETEGVELEASYSMASGFYLDLNGTVSSGLEYPGINNNNSWRNELGDNVQLTLGRKWDERLDLSWEVVNVFDKRFAGGTVKNPDSTVHNLRATWRPERGWLQGAEFRVGVENVFDLNYNQHLSSVTRKAPGRTFKVSLTKRF